MSSVMEGSTMSNASIDVLLLNPNVTPHREDGASVGTIGVPDDYLVRCINAGVLSIASWLAQRGLRVRILDFLDDLDLGPLHDLLARERPKVVGISVMTAFAYPHARELARAVRMELPDVLLVLGGQHVGPCAKDALDDVPEADAVALYEGEEVTLALVEVAEGRKELAEIPGLAWRKGEHRGERRDYPPMVPLSEMAPLRYDLYPRFHTFLPYVEESRGCFAKCSFCITPFTNDSRIRGKSAEQLLVEVDHALASWRAAGANGSSLALLAATFGSRPAETTKLIEGLGRRGCTWTSEFRADGYFAKRLEFVADNGAKALFVGVESCSPRQLVAMNKTRQPERYLASLSELLEQSLRCPSVLVKLGLLFYVGETAGTQRETLGYLFRHIDRVRWVSVSPLFVFGGTPLERAFPSYQRDHGARLHTTGFWGDNRIYACHVSREFSFQDSVEAARYTEKLFRQPDAFDVVFERKPAAAAP